MERTWSLTWSLRTRSEPHLIHGSFTPSYRPGHRTCPLQQTTGWPETPLLTPARRCRPVSEHTDASPIVPPVLHIGGGCIFGNLSSDSGRRSYMKHASHIAITVAFVVLLAACGDGDPASADADAATSVPATTPSTTTTTFPVTLVPSTTKGPAASVTNPPPAQDFVPGDDQVAYAIADLAGRLGIDEEIVVVAQQSEVIWNDGSIGCPQPGMFYTQALVDGVQIILEVDGEQYDYHAAASRAPFLCENAVPTDKSG